MAGRTSVTSVLFTLQLTAAFLAFGRSTLGADGARTAATLGRGLHKQFAALRQGSQNTAGRSLLAEAPDESLLATPVSDSNFNAAAVAQTPNATFLVVLGDSYSDTGNRAAFREGPDYPVPEWYWRGRYCDGPLWVDQLKRNNGGRLQVFNFAFAGAVACQSVEWQQFFWTMPEQIDMYFSKYIQLLPPPPQRFVAFQFGANDYLRELQNITRFEVYVPLAPELVKRTTNCLKDGLIRLINAGETRILVFNGADFADTPQPQLLLLEPIKDLSIDVLVNMQNEATQRLVDELSNAYPHVTLALFDLYSATRQVHDHPEQYGMKNVNDACIDYRLPGVIGDAIQAIPVVGNAINQVTGVELRKCSNPSEYYWYDRVHLTLAVHSVIAQAVSDRLKQLGWL